MRRKTIKHAFSVLYSDKTWAFDQSERAQGPIYIIYKYIYILFLFIYICRFDFDCPSFWQA